VHAENTQDGLEAALMVHTTFATDAYAEGIERQAPQDQYQYG
jgi:hypothetical protein